MGTFAKQRDIHQYSAENIVKWGKLGKNQAFNKAMKEIEKNSKDISENNSNQGSSGHEPSSMEFSLELSKGQKLDHLILDGAFKIKKVTFEKLLQGQTTG